MLRAEVELLRSQNTELGSKLREVERRLEHHDRELKQHLQEELSSMKAATQATGKPLSLAAAEQMLSQLERARQALQELLLSPWEVQEARLRCCWLAHYWGLAAKLGLYPEVAAAQAAFWQPLAPATTSMEEAARALCKRPQDATQPPSTTDASREGSIKSQLNTGATIANGSSNAEARSGNASSNGLKTDASLPSWLKQRPGGAASCVQTSASDMVAIERGLRQLQALRVPEAVNELLLERGLAQQAQPPQATAAALDALLQPSMSVMSLSEEQSEDVCFKRAWLALLWRRAAELGVELQVSEARAEYWRSRLGRTPTARDPEDTGRALQELQVLGIEQKIWQCRRTMRLEAAEPQAAVQQTALST